MKHLLSFLALSIATTFSAFSQYNFSASATTANLNIGLVPAIQVNIYESDIDEVEKQWSSILKKRDGKITHKGAEYMADNVNYPELSNTPVDMHYIFKEEGDIILMTLTVDLGTGMLDPGNFPNQFNVMKGMVTNFSKTMTKASLQDKQKEQDKVLKNEEDNLKKLEKELKRLEETIADAEQKIKEANQEIIENKEEQSAKKIAIEKQKQKTLDLAAKLKGLN